MGERSRGSAQSPACGEPRDARSVPPWLSLRDVAALLAARGARDRRRYGLHASRRRAGHADDRDLQRHRARRDTASPAPGRMRATWATSARAPSPAKSSRAAGEHAARDAALLNARCDCVYTLLWWLALPFLPLRLWWRGRREPAYRAHVGERFGRYAGAARGAGNDVLWIHAVSLGETRAVAPLIERLQREAPRRTILLTHMTATGREAGRALFGNRVVQAWLPYDVPFAVRALPRAFPAARRPARRNGAVAEPHRGGRAPRRAADADQRASVGALRSGYRRIAPVVAAALRRAFRNRRADPTTTRSGLRDLGARDVVVTGNLKFDVAIPRRATRARRSAAEAVRRGAAGAGARVDARWRGSAAARRARPRRGDAAATNARCRSCRGIRSASTRSPRCSTRGSIPFARRSANGPVPADVRVVLGDSLGEMFAYYAAADVAFVAGSLLAAGRAEPDRADRRRRPDAGRAAHVQFRAGERCGRRGGRGAARSRCRRRIRRRRPAARRCAARAKACAPPRRRSWPRIAARSTGCGTGSRLADREIG